MYICPCHSLTSSQLTLPSHSFLKDGFAGHRIIDYQHFLSALWICHPHCLLASKVSDEELAVNLIEDPLYVKSCFSIAAPRIHSWSLDRLTMISLSVHLFEFILPEVHWTSWICRLMFSIKFGKFGAIISSNTFLASVSLSFCNSIMHMLVYLMVSYLPLRLCYFIYIFSFCVSEWIMSIDLSS